MKTVLICNASDADKTASRLIEAGITFETRVVSTNDIEEVHFLVNDADFGRAADMLEAYDTEENMNLDLSQLSSCPHCGELGPIWFARTENGQTRDVFLCAACQRPVAVRDPKTKIGWILE